MTNYSWSLIFSKFALIFSELFMIFPVAIIEGWYTVVRIRCGSLLLLTKSQCYQISVDLNTSLCSTSFHAMKLYSFLHTCTGWTKKTAHGFLCYNFAYSQSFFIIFGTYTVIHYRKFATGWCIVSPPNTVCVTTLPCKILNHNFIHVHFYSLFQKCYPFTLVIIANFCQIFINIIFEKSYVKIISYL